MALEEIFFRMVIPSDGVGPNYVGLIEPRHRFPDLSHPTQLQGEEFLAFMGAGKKITPAKVMHGGKEAQVPHFGRRPNIMYPEGSNVETLSGSMITKMTDVNMF